MDQITLLLYGLIGCMVITIVLLIIILVRKADKKAGEALLRDLQAEYDRMQQGLAASFHDTADFLCDNTTNAMQVISETLQSGQKQIGDMQNDAIRSGQQGMDRTLSLMEKSVDHRLAEMEKKLSGIETATEQKLSRIDTGVRDSLREMREENSKKLDEIRGVVDEKLQDTLNKRLNESFQTVSQQLQEVYKGLGEMKNLASDVGGLKKVLSGVKTRGILGEIQLGAILEEILTPDQYDTNVATIPKSKDRVEFAVRLPGDDGKPVYLPIDSKFPGDRYQQLVDARETGDREAEQTALKELEAVLRSEAKDIRDKYIEVPHTTSFAIMFLPFEGLYAEVVNRGLLERLQREFSVNIAGPSTMAALLNSLQMGFRTLAIQKRSSEVWTVLGAVKTEFGKFHDILGKMQTHLSQTATDLETLIGTRTNKINTALKKVETLDTGKAQQILGLDAPDDAD